MEGRLYFPSGTQETICCTEIPPKVNCKIQRSEDRQRFYSQSKSNLATQLHLLIRGQQSVELEDKAYEKECKKSFGKVVTYGQVIQVIQYHKTAN